MSTAKKIGSGVYRSGPLPLIAKAMGRKYNVHINISDKNRPSTDGNTIFLPGLSIDGTPEEVCKLNGFLDHEVGHIRFSDFKQLKGCTPLEKLLSNVLEDPRIERLMEHRYPGVKINLDGMYTLMEKEAKAKAKAPSEPLDPAAILCRGLLVKLLIGIGRAGVTDSNWRELEGLFGRPLSEKILEIGEAVVASDSRSACLTGAKAIIRLLNMPNPEEVEIEIDMDGFNPHDAGDVDEETGAIKIRVKVKGQAKSQAGTPQKGSNPSDDADDGDTGSGSGSGNDPAEAGQETDQGGQDGQGDSDQGDSDQEAGNPGDSTAQEGSEGGSSAADSGTHVGNEAIDAVLRINDADLDRIVHEMDVSGAAVQSMAKPTSGRRGNSLTDDHIQATPWTGSPKNVQILDVDRIAKPLQYRLEDLIQNRLRNDYYTRPIGVRMLKRRTGLYETGVRNIFKQSEEQEVMDTAVYVTFDISGSMSGKNLETAKIATIGIGDALQGFEGLTYKVSSFDTNVFTYDENWVKARQQIAGTPANGGTSYGPAFMHGIDWLQSTEKERKLFILVTDGEPSDPDEAKAVADYAREAGVEVFGLSIVGGLTSALRQIFEKSADSVADVRKLPAVLGDLIEKNM